MKMGEVFQKVPNGDQKQKCNFYNRGFCNKEGSAMMTSVWTGIHLSVGTSELKGLLVGGKL